MNRPLRWLAGCLLPFLLVFTACGTPSISLDWERIPVGMFDASGDQTILGITAGGPGLVAVGYASSGEDRVAAVWTSVDGSTWRRVAHDPGVFGGGESVYMTAVTRGGPGLVAVGEDFNDGVGAAAVWTSSNGLTWRRVAHDNSTFGSSYEKGEKIADLFVAENVVAVMLDVAAGGPGLVAVGSDQATDIIGQAAVWTSPDGLHWTRVRDQDAFRGSDVEEMWSVTAGGPGLVAVGNGSLGKVVVWTSVDGLTWTRVPHDDEVFGSGGAPLRMYSITAGGPGLVAVGYDSSIKQGVAAVWTSLDGFTWQRLPHSQVFGGSKGVGMNAVAAGSLGLVAVGYDDANGDAAAWTSSDGVEWERLRGVDAFKHDESSGYLGINDVTVVGPGFAAGDVEQYFSLSAVVWIASVASP